MENNVKIQNLMKKGLYAEAKKIAQSSKFPDEIIAEINKEYGDKLYKEKNHTEAKLKFQNIHPIQRCSGLCT
jgi:hypothetical protein